MSGSGKMGCGGAIAMGSGTVTTVTGGGAGERGCSGRAAAGGGRDGVWQPAKTNGASISQARRMNFCTP